MKKAIKRVVVVLIAVLLVQSAFFSVYAESGTYVPYENYTYWDNIAAGGRKSVYNRPMYEVQDVIDAKSIGVGAFDEIIDVYSDRDGYVYILDSQSRIVILDSNFDLVREISAVHGDKEYTFTGAKSVFVHTNGIIYISDTENNRVILCDSNGEYLDEYIVPDSPLIPENFDFRPMRTVVDSKGYVYILSDGSYYGALLYAPDKSFIGFYGSNTVVNGILGAFKSLLERMIPNNTKKSASQRMLPYVFSDIVIDKYDFIYTATDSLSVAQIKKLSPGTGNNILNSDSVNFADDGVNRTYRNGEAFKQTIIGLDVDDNGMIYCLDSAYGRIYVYDSECNMITAFGGGMGAGKQKGVFTTASAVTIHKDKILVSDKTNNNITVFSCNDYGKKVMELIKLTGNGDYTESKEGWLQVLQQDRNLQIAYTGLSLAYYAEGEYKLAMESAIEGYDRASYLLSFEAYRSNWVSENFTWFFSIIIFGIALIITSVIVISKKKIRIIKNHEAQLMLKASIHPGNVFTEIKERQKGSVGLAILMLLIFYVSTVVSVLFGGFLFTMYDEGTYNSLWVFVRSIGLVLLWVIANWLVCTLVGGKGKMREIFIITCYSLMPFIVKNIIWTVLSNVLLPTEGSFLNILSAAAAIYALIIFTIGMLHIHDFTMSAFIGTSILTVCGMAAIVFLIILVGILLQQLGGFIVTILIEFVM